MVHMRKSTKPFYFLGICIEIAHGRKTLHTLGLWSDKVVW